MDSKVKQIKSAVRLADLDGVKKVSVKIDDLRLLVNELDKKTDQVNKLTKKFNNLWETYHMLTSAVKTQTVNLESYYA